jgi:diguanylate cyclase (GGDEF)-like protein
MSVNESHSSALSHGDFLTRMQKIAILYDASQAVLSTFDEKEVLDRILVIARDYFQLDCCTILLIEQDGNLRVHSSTGYEGVDLSQPIPLGRGLIGSAAQWKQLIYASDVSKDSRYINSIPSTRSEVAVPLMVRDRVVGVLDCQSDHLHHFDDESIDLLMLFSTQASIALENARLHDLERRRSRQLEAINTIARQITAVVDIDELLHKAGMLIIESFAVEHAMVLLNEDEGMVLRAHEGNLTPLTREGFVLPHGSGLAARVMESGRPLIENNVSTNPEYFPAVAETRSEIILPLVSMGQTIGVLAVESSRPDAFEKADLTPLESVADICASAIQNARYFDRIRQLAYRDGLTGSFNRRFFEMRILEEIERVKRYDSVLSVVMIDIDCFKTVNDEFGHLLGDEVLRQVTTLISPQLRRSDVLCRYGGDELAILLPETDPERAASAAEKLRKTIAAWEFSGVPKRVTISAGVASSPAHGKDRDQLIKAADHALYRAKQAGRNCVHSAGKARVEA